jgi:lysozyme
LKTSINGIKALHGSEACALKAYLDSGGIYTIGWGSTTMFGNPVRKGMTCTQQEADEQAFKDVAEVEKVITKVVKVELTQNQFDALVNLGYNIGTNALANSTLVKKLNLGDYAGAAQQFMRWVYDNGKEVEGLKNRRRREKELFLK